MALSTPVEEIVRQSSDPLLSKHDSWERVSLAELAEVLNGFAFKSSRFNKERGTPLIRIRDVGKDSTDVLYDGPYEEQYVVEAGDLLIGMDGDFNSARWKGSRALLNQRVCKVELKSEHFSAGFLEHALPGYLKAINDKTSAVTVKHLSSKSVKEIPLPLPPLNEQRRIVEKIEELFTKLDAGVRSLEQARAQLKNYRRSVLKAAVEGELSREWREAHGDEVEPASDLLERILQERRDMFAGKKYKEPVSPDTSKLPALPNGWIWAKTDQLFTFVTSGSRGWAKYYSDEGPTFLRIGNLDHDSISLDLRSIQKVQPSEGAEGTRTRVICNDVLISITADVGMIAVIPPDFEETYINQHIALARPSHRMNVAYLAWYLVSEPGNKQLTGRQYGATKPGLNLDDIRAVDVPVPPFEEQRFIVEEVDRRLSIVDKLEATVEANLKQAGALRQSILKRAFSGKLVPQDPDDEPASVLLERIRKERQAAKPKPRRGRESDAGSRRAGAADQIGLFDGM